MSATAAPANESPTPAPTVSTGQPAVVGVHGVGGLIGLIMVGPFATARISGKKGLFYGGG